jgi:probable HAF family extracellular repeat protein
VAWSECCGSGLGVPNAINRAGEVAGYNEGGFDTYPVFWSKTGAAIELPGQPGGNGRGAAGDINDAGLVAGYTRDPDGVGRHAVLWQAGLLVRDLGFMGQAAPGQANQTLAYGLNNQNQVVGAGLVGSEFHAFVWSDGTFTDLGAGAALDVTDDGSVIVGTAPGGVPVVWRSGVRSFLPGLGGAQVAYGHIVSAMNNKGLVVGYAPSPKPPYLDTAVLWRGKAIDLGRYPGGTVSRAYGLNDKGEVVGEGNLAPDGPMHALRWTLKTGQASRAELQH